MRMQSAVETPARARWHLVALAASLALVSSVVLGWIIAHPRISGWDEVEYILLPTKDEFIRHTGGWGAMRDAWFNDYRLITPGPRLLAFPLSLAGALTPFSLRIMSWLLWLFSLAIIWDAARRVSSISAAAAATALIAVAPQFALSAENYMSEALLVPSVSVVLWCLLREAGPRRRGAWNAVLLGAALGTGLLARFSFVPLAGAAVALMVWLALARIRSRDHNEVHLPQRLWRLALALLIATLLAWPHYAYNGVRYVGYARFALTFPLTELASSGSLDFARKYLDVLCDAFGLFALLGILSGIAMAFRSMARPTLAALRQLFVSMPDQRVFAFISCLFILVPTVISHIAGHNQNPRYLVGVMPASALLVAIGLAGSGAVRVLASGLAVAQAALMVAAMLAPFPPAWDASGIFVLDAPDGIPKVATSLGPIPDPWLRPLASLLLPSHRDNPVCHWQGLVDLAGKVGKPVPTIRFVGVSDALNHVQIELAFYSRGVAAHVIPADMTPRPPDPAELDAARAADVVLALEPSPGLHWYPNIPDPNRHNADVIAALRASPEFVPADLGDRGPSADCRLVGFLPRHS